MGTWEERKECPVLPGGVTESFAEEAACGLRTERRAGLSQGQYQEVRVCVEGHHTGGTGESYLWLLRSTYKGGGQRRLKRLGKDPQGGPCVSCQGAEVLSMPVR